MCGYRRTPALTLLLCCLMLDSARGQNGCEDCYRIDGGVIAGIVIGDVIMTVMIAMTMYYFARRSVKHSNAGIEVQIPRNKSKLETESPYEELQLSQRGLYSELKPSHK